MINLRRTFFFKFVDPSYSVLPNHYDGDLVTDFRSTLAQLNMQFSSLELEESVFTIIFYLIATSFVVDKKKYLTNNASAPIEYKF